MSVFSLASDKQFIRAVEGSEEILACTYLDDLNDFGMSRHGHIKWSTPTPVGPTASKFKELEVLGVTIGGDRLKELIQDLTVPGETARLRVNGQGLCVLSTGARSIKRPRINDRFGWSKYGVKPPIDTSTIWSVCDMSSGAVLVAPPGGDGGDDNDDGDHDSKSSSSSSSTDWEKVVQEKEKEMEEKESLLRKTLEQKEKEVVSLKAALNALIVN